MSTYGNKAQRESADYLAGIRRSLKHLEDPYSDFIKIDKYTLIRLSRIINIEVGENSDTLNLYIRDLGVVTIRNNNLADIDEELRNQLLHFDLIEEIKVDHRFDLRYSHKMPTIEYRIIKKQES